MNPNYEAKVSPYSYVAAISVIAVRLWYWGSSINSPRNEDPQAGGRKARQAAGEPH